MGTSRFWITFALIAWTATTPTKLRGGSLDALLSKPTRPTIAEVLPVLADIPDTIQTPGGGDSRTDQKLFLGYLFASAPHFIARIEKTYPRAKWYFLGRDTQSLGDLLEAYYLGLGQADRVERIGMSKGTLPSLEDDASTLAFLTDHGFPTEALPPERPHIIIDSVSRFFGTQGRTLLSAVYRKYAKSGRNPADLLRTVNMLGMIVRLFAGPPHPCERAEEYLTAEESRYRSGATIDYFKDHLVLTYQDPGDYPRYQAHHPETQFFCESGYAHHVGAWHDAYGAVTRDEAGLWRATPGQLWGTEWRRSILAMQKQIYTRATSAEFRAQVVAEAEKLGLALALPSTCAQKIAGEAP